MHAKPSDKLVMMANQISKNLAIQGEERAIAEMSSHVRRYWEPRMRETMKAYIEADGSALEPLAMRALQAVWPDVRPGKTANSDGDGMLALPTASNQSNRTPPENEVAGLQQFGAVPKVSTVATGAPPPERSEAQSGKKPSKKRK